MKNYMYMVCAIAATFLIIILSDILHLNTPWHEAIFCVALAIWLRGKR